ncbi:MAG: recombinase [Clostridiales bacterium]|nr:recombinase [Clostridiales bacterium]
MSSSAKMNTTKQKVGKELSKKDITYIELCQMYIRECKLNDIADVTINGYNYANKYFLRFTGKGIMCSEITQELVDDYKMELLKRLKPTTLNSYMFKISPTIKYGHRVGLIKEEILITHVREQETFKDIYTEEELKKLLVRPKNKSFSQYRNWVIINFLIATGIRSKELRELNVSNVDLDMGFINLPHTKNRKARIIPMPSSLIKIMIEYINIRGGELSEPLFCNQFGERLPRTTLQLEIKKYCLKRDVHKYSLHLFRHTFITLSVRKGMSPLQLKRITGHADFRMLNKYYQYDPSDLMDIIDEYNPLETFKKKQVIKMGKKV